MKIVKQGNSYMVSDISVKEIFDTLVACNKAHENINGFICSAIRIRALQKIRRKGIESAILNYVGIKPVNGFGMSIDVIQSVMKHYSDQMSSNVKRTFDAQCSTRIEIWSKTKSWAQFMQKLNVPCPESDYVVTEGIALRMNILAGILRKDPNAKLDELTIEMALDSW